MGFARCRAANPVSRRTGFTLIELLVVIAIIALLMAILMPAMSKVRREANGIRCMANLHQWALCFEIYLLENHAFIKMGRRTGMNMSEWIRVMYPYYKDRGILICPMAKKLAGRQFGGAYDKYGGTFSPWHSEVFVEWAPLTGWTHGPVTASYGINAWTCDVDPKGNASWLKLNNNWYWKGINVKRANKVPLVLDCIFSGGLPRVANIPLQFPLEQYPPLLRPPLFQAQMNRFFIARHGHGVNILFADSSSRKTPLKDMYTLRWHRRWPKNYLGPIDGEPFPVGWPSWVKK